MRRQIVEAARSGGAKAANVLRESLQWEILAAMHGAVRLLWVRFTGVLKEVGASPMASQKVGIKLEFDLNPPPGANFSVQVVSNPP